MASVNHIRFRPLSAVKRSILKPGPQRREIRFGLLKGLNLRVDFQGQAQLYFGLYETETFAFCRAAAARAQWMVDIGAGTGELALYFMKINGPDTVLAFEPSPGEREIFTENLLANGWGGDDASISGSPVGTGEGCQALDRMGLDLTKRGFVKIDVDGAEMDVLESGPELLRSGMADFLVETHSRDLEDRCVALFEANGYRTDIIPNAWWRVVLPERRPVEHNRWLSAVRG